MTSLFGRMATTQTCRCRCFFAVPVLAEDNKAGIPRKECTGTQIRTSQ